MPLYDHRTLRATSDECRFLRARWATSNNSSTTVLLYHLSSCYCYYSTTSVPPAPASPLTLLLLPLLIVSRLLSFQSMPLLLHPYRSSGALLLSPLAPPRSPEKKHGFLVSMLWRVSCCVPVQPYILSEVCAPSTIHDPFDASRFPSCESSGINMT